METLNVAIIGCGSIAELAHIPNYISDPRSTIVALCDSSEKRLDEMLAKFGIDAGYTSHLEMLEREQPDCVSVCVPPRLHPRTCVDALSKGSHVLCEKPLALSTAEAREMIDAADRNSKKIMVGHHLRFLKTHTMAKDMLQTGRIGEALTFRAQIATGGPFHGWKTASRYHLEAGSGSDVIWNFGTHLVDLLRFFFGEVRSCSGYTRETGSCGQPGIIDLASLNLTFDQVVGSAMLFYTMNQSMYESNLEVSGTGGMIITRIMSPGLWLQRSGTLLSRSGPVDVTPRMRPIDDPYRLEVSSFLDYILEDKMPRVTGMDGLRTVEVLEGVLTGHPGRSA